MKHIGEILCIGIAATLLGGPPCYPIGSLVELLIKLNVKSTYPLHIVDTSMFCDATDGFYS